jgi:hypothetical protein
MSQAWPDVRDADELHDALLSLVAIPDSTCGTGSRSPTSWRVRVGPRGRRHA